MSINVIRLRTVAVLLLLALWVPVTSHTLLEQAGVIHTSDSHHDDDHDAADGVCVNAATYVKAPQSNHSIVQDILIDRGFWTVVSVVETSVPEANGPAPPGVAPPEISQTWHFVSRTALPARAPSYLS